MTAESGEPADPAGTSNGGVDSPESIETIEDADCFREPISVGEGNFDGRVSSACEGSRDVLDASRRSVCKLFPK